MTIATTNEGRPDIEYRRIIQDSGDPVYVNRVLIGTATTGLVRIEWVGARYSVTLPVNWSQVEMTQQIPTYIPLRYQVADAQNLIVKHCLDAEFEWLLLLEHDVLIQADAFLIFNEYLQEKHVPIVSGLYYSRSHPSVPLVFRGRGNGVYTDWQMGDKVYVDGVPTGLLMIHTSILKLMWDDSAEYNCQGIVTRRVFDTPRKIWDNPVTGYHNRMGGTSDLDWCTKVMEGDYIRRAGWTDYMDGLEDERYPFLLDTRLFARHIEKTGEMFP
jgi:hypothetical protein